MKTKITALTLFVFLFTGCGITYGTINPETKEVSFWLGKEYDQFVLVYEKDGEKLTIFADKVQALKSQKLIQEGLVGAVKAGICGISPLPSCPAGVQAASPLP